MQIGRDAQSVKSLSRHTLEQLVTLSSEGILLADAQDPNLTIVYANPAYEDLTGYSAKELTGTSWPLVKRDGEGQPELERLKAAIGRSEPCQVTLPDLRKDGTPWFSEVSVEPLYNARGELKYFLCRQKPVDNASVDNASVDSAGVDSVNGEGAEPADVEVTLLQRELGRARQKIANLNRADPATGLMRFGYFLEILRRDLAIARREQRFVTLLCFEILEFDAYRKVFGSKAADSCQRMIGAQVTRVLRRASDLSARYDDSALVSSVLGQQPSDASRLADQIADNVRKLGLHNPRAKSGRYVTIRTALIACPPGANDDVEVLIARALKDLRAKEAGSDARAVES
jgi:PAS domain S-box-containing protein/diguanylate cyclase (GGDEF)-like protein